MSKKTPTFELTPEQQAAYEQYLDAWEKLSVEQQQRIRQQSRADNLAHGLPLVGAALLNNASEDEIQTALQQDGWEQKRQRIAEIQEQAAMILQLLLNQNDPISFRNMGEVWKPNKHCLLYTSPSPRD